MIDDPDHGEHPSLYGALRSFRLTPRGPRTGASEEQACAELAAIAGQQVDLEYTDTIENVDGEPIAELPRVESVNLCFPYTTAGSWPDSDELDTALDELLGTA